MRRGYYISETRVVDGKRRHTVMQREAARSVETARGKVAGGNVKATKAEIKTAASAAALEEIMAEVRRIMFEEPLTTAMQRDPARTAVALQMAKVRAQREAGAVIE